ncbi:hypothetical protein [Myroides injenensis]|uniref:hypothetical protein n=1 Tax=Myroides injenensis TaxID=1183151 RepID=UPI000289BF60|nr:hypothetical protein [Myroides injenensis]
MKVINNDKYNIMLRLLYSLIIVFISLQVGFAQVQVDFKPRTSKNAPNPYKEVKNYALQGDFKMIGNTNMTLVDYSDESTNVSQMRYVDVDNDESTVNSSSSTLVLDGDKNCNDIVYAGLYWSARAHHQLASPNIFEGSKGILEPGAGESFPKITKNYRGPSTVDNTHYTVSVVTGDRNGYKSTIFRVNSIYGDTKVIIRAGYSTYGSGYVDYSIDNGKTWQTANARVTPNSVNPVYKDMPIDKISFSEGSVNLSITNVSAYIPQYGGADYRYIEAADLKIEVSGRKNNIRTVTATLDKTKVKLKKAGQEYIEVSAANNEILYPSGRFDNIFVGYADITDYVRKNGAGEYFVGNLACMEGTGGNVGYYGGWGMVVVYKNATMKWRDITVYDGYAYIANTNTSTNVAYELAIDGIRAAQRGDVNLTIGVMAGEGDYDVSGDYFHIRDAANKKWVPLSHPGNTADNFFNSSIYTEGNPRNPNLKNNTGIDISKFNFDNSKKDIIANNQTSTKFLYGTKGDAYVIYNLVLAVDAYFPEIIVENKPSNFTPSKGVKPGDELEFYVSIKNKGTEAAKDGKVTIELPWNVNYKSSNKNVTWTPPKGARPDATNANTSGGTLTWNIGNIEKPADIDKILADMTYKVKVIEDCTLLRSFNCKLQVSIDGKFTGTGLGTGDPVESGLVIGTDQYCGSGPIYGTFNSDIIFDSSKCNNADFKDNVREFVLWCGGTEIPRNQIANEYPQGTLFYRNMPGTAGAVLVTGNFMVHPNYDTGIIYYAVIPGGDEDCYHLLATRRLAIPSKPIVNNLSTCVDTSIQANVKLSEQGKSLGLQLYYFDSNGNKLPNDVFIHSKPGNYTYYAAEGKEGCYGEKIPFIITVKEIPALSSVNQPKSISLCTGSDGSISASMDNGVSNGGWEYLNASNQWVSLNNNSFSGLLTVKGNEVAISNASNTINDLQLRIKLLKDDCVGYSNIAKITVYPIPKLNREPSDIAVCQDGTAELNAELNPDYRYSRWEYFDENTKEWTWLRNATFSGLIGVADLKITIIKGDPSINNLKLRLRFTDSKTNCFGYSRDVKITVLPLPSLSSSNQPKSVSLCTGSNGRISATMDNGVSNGGWEYLNASNQWVSLNNNSFSGLLTVKDNEVAITNASSTINDLQLRIKLLKDGCVSYSDIAKITVFPMPKLNQEPQDIRVCQDGTAELIAVLNPGDIYDQWEYFDENTKEWTWLRNITFDGLVGIDMVRITIKKGDPSINNLKIRMKFVDGKTNCFGYSREVEIIVLPLPSLSSSNQPKSVSLCTGSDGNISATMDNGVSNGGWEYLNARNQWVSLNNNSFSGLLTVKDNEVAITNASNTINELQLRIKLLKDGCVGYSDIAKITVYPIPKLNREPSDIVVCQNGTAELIAELNPGDEYDQWEYFDENTKEWTWLRNVTFDGLVGIDMVRITIKKGDPSINNLKIRMKFVDGETNCFGYSREVEITVLPLPSLSSSNQPKSVSLCAGSDGNISASMDNGVSNGGWEYLNASNQWVSLNNNSFSGLLTVKDNEVAITNASSTINDLQLRIKLLKDGCVGYSDIAKITVFPIPLLTVEPEDTYVCLGESKLISVQLDNNLTYQEWQYFNKESKSWEKLDNTTFRNILKVEQTTINILESDEIIDNLQLRMTFKNEQGCVGSSKEFTIEVRNCKIPVNPFFMKVSNK